MFLKTIGSHGVFQNPVVQLRTTSDMGAFAVINMGISRTQKEQKVLTGTRVEMS